MLIPSTIQHINVLYGAGCYGVSCVLWYVNFGLRGAGGHIYLHLSTSHALCAREEMAATHERFEFSQQSTSNDHYIARNDSSSPTLPTINDIRCEIGNTSNYYSCTVYALQFQDTHQRGWLKHGNMVQIAFLCRHRVSRLGRDRLQRG